MTILTPELRQAIAQSGDEPVHLVDPEMNTAYVLVRADVYERLLSMIDADDFDPGETYPFIDEVMREDDANDPTLEGYQHLGGTTP